MLAVFLGVIALPAANAQPCQSTFPLATKSLSIGSDGNTLRASLIEGNYCQIGLPAEVIAKWQTGSLYSVFEGVCSCPSGSQPAMGNVASGSVVDPAKYCGVCYYPWANGTFGAGPEPEPCNTYYLSPTGLYDGGPPVFKLGQGGICVPDSTNFNTNKEYSILVGTTCGTCSNQVATGMILTGAPPYKPCRICHDCKEYKNFRPTFNSTSTYFNLTEGGNCVVESRNQNRVVDYTDYTILVGTQCGLCSNQVATGLIMDDAPPYNLCQICQLSMPSPDCKEYKNLPPQPFYTTSVLFDLDPIEGIFCQVDPQYSSSTNDITKTFTVLVGTACETRSNQVGIGKILLNGTPVLPNNPCKIVDPNKT